MIDPVSFLVMAVIVIGLSQVIKPAHPHLRLAWITVPGVFLLFIAHPNALWFAVAAFVISIAVRWLATKAAPKRQAWYPYSILLLLFAPDVFNLSFTPLLYLGSAFFIIRQMMTVAHTVKKHLPYADFVPSLLAATFFFAAIPSGPVFNGVNVWDKLKERGAAEYGQGTYRLVEGFVYLFAVAGIANSILTRVNDADLGFITGTLLARPAASFVFLFATFYGYSRMAEGTAKLFGFEVPQNFNRPQQATDLSDYWKRWHASMAGFVMQYIYLPVLVATKQSKAALAAAFVFMGLWHELSIAFLIWGLGHGIGLGVILPWARKRKIAAPVIRYSSFAWVLGFSSIAHGVWFG